MDIRHLDLPVLRDDLALHRTILANERTMLSYIRTALTLFAAGATFVKFFDHSFVVTVGWLMIPISLATLIKGLVSYSRTKREIIREEEKVLKDVHTG